MSHVYAVAAAIIALVATTADAIAQAPAAPPRIGYLETNASPGWFEGFRRGLNELGYVENRTIIIERRSAVSQAERLADLAAELVRLNPQVIVASSPPAALAVKNATTTIPIVVANTTDAVGLGLVASLAHPGGNVTGLSSLQTDLMGKRLELLGELVPGLSRVGVIWEPGVEGPKFAYRELQAAAKAANLALESFEINRPEDIEPVFDAAAARVRAVVVLNGPIIGALTETVVAAARHKVPAIYYDTRYAEAGGLLSYGANITDLHRRAATFVSKILRGAKPADLPLLHPSEFEFVVNLATAAALGLSLPQALLSRAEKISG